MKTNKEVKISYWAHHLTTIISVTLVLVLMGVIGLVWIGAETETRRLKEKIELSVVMADSVPAQVTSALAGKLREAPYARDVRVISKEEALQIWIRETGEDLNELFGVNPLSEEITFGVRADYASAAAINRIKSRLEKEPGVEAVSVPDSEMVEAMNRNISRITLILGIIVAIMLLISFVLINNTVHLTIYSRRFTIHTMKLVGATDGFIRRPVVLNNMLAGLLSGLLAIALLVAAAIAARQAGVVDISSLITPGWLAVVAAAMVIAGVALCALASWWSANTYLRKDYAQLFR